MHKGEHRPAGCWSWVVSLAGVRSKRVCWRGDLNGKATAVRLDTTWTRDQPLEVASLRVGDAISGTSSWGGAVRFGGVQWSTNFSTQPGFIAFPLPGVSGEAALPSTVDLYVDSALRMSREVPSGPFSIQDLPVTTGQGDARLVVRDILGREQVITQPFYTTPRLLKPGLQEYSYELGFVRRNFGTDSNNYGRPLAVGTHRLGITKHFTGELHGELLGHQQTVGLGGVLMWPVAGVLSGSLAMRATAIRAWADCWSLGFSVRAATLVSAPTLSSPASASRSWDWSPKHLRPGR